MSIPQTAPEKIISQLHRSLSALQQAPGFSKNMYMPSVMAAVHRLAETEQGIEYLYEIIGELYDADLFTEGPWEDPQALVPSLVSGTLKSGGETTNMEILSELRMLAIANGLIKDGRCSSSEARDFLHEVLANNLDFVFPDRSEESRSIDPETWVKIRSLFSILLEHLPFKGIKANLLEEIQMITAQRPIITNRVTKILEFIHNELELDRAVPEEQALENLVNARYAPTDYLQSREGSYNEEKYRSFLEEADDDTLMEECQQMGQSLVNTGIGSKWHVYLLEKVVDRPFLVKEVLALNKSGRTEYDNHREMAEGLISTILDPALSRCLYGAGRMLERNLLSHQPVKSALKRLFKLQLHPAVEENIFRSTTAHHMKNPEARRMLIADTLCILGQPLGIGQGWNPTCQSARGISLWSQHAPGKLLRKIITAASENNLSMRFEEELIESDDLVLGLAKDFDYHLDIVSIVLVPHLDKIYNEMMRRCSLRQEDGHKWVNPALYGQWIPTGFISAYDVTTHAIKDYRNFVRVFYATHHPDYNGENDLTYPNPVGIFITSATGKLLGFHAVSILRVDRDEDQMRVYFLNPNNEGRQSWGGEITPTVAGHGEEHGESSLPFYQFASRLYAFHYHQSEARDLEAISEEKVTQVEEIARNSWGESYIWT